MKLAAIVLSAGAGVRFGGDKLSVLFRGEPLLCHAIDVARAAPVERVVAVCAPSLDVRCRDHGGAPLDFVRIESGSLSESLQAGIAAAGAVDGVFVFLGDMPLVPRTLAHRLAAALENTFAVVPRYRGNPGHPVLLSSLALPAMAGLTGDQGAGRLLRERRDVTWVDVDDEGVVLDVDRVEDLALLEQRGATRP